MCNDFCLIFTTCKPSVNSKMSLFFADDAPWSWRLSGAKISARKFEAVVLCWKMVGFLGQRVQVSQRCIRLHRSLPGQHQNPVTMDGGKLNWVPFYNFLFQWRVFCSQFWMLTFLLMLPNKTQYTLSTVVLPTIQHTCDTLLNAHSS